MPSKWSKEDFNEYKLKLLISWAFCNIFVFELKLMCMSLLQRKKRKESEIVCTLR